MPPSSDCRLSSRRPSGIEANSNISPWLGFKPKQEFANSGFFAGCIVACSAGARRGFCAPGASMAAELGPDGARAFQDNGSDVFGLYSRARVHRLEADLDRNCVPGSDVG